MSSPIELRRKAIQTQKTKSKRRINKAELTVRICIYLIFAIILVFAIMFGVEVIREFT